MLFSIDIIFNHFPTATKFGLEKGMFDRGNAVKFLYRKVNSKSQELLEISTFYSAAEIRLLFKSCCAATARNEVVANGSNFIAKASSQMYLRSSVDS